MTLCPYCSADLRREPKRKMSCPSCGASVHIRQGRARTEAEARALDCCSRLQITEGELLKTREQLSARLGRTADFGEALRSLVDGRIERATTLHDRKMLHFDMALYLWESGQDCHAELQQAARAEIEGYKEDCRSAGLTARGVRLRVLSAGDSCAECRRLASREFTIAEAASAMPLPVLDCTHDRTDGRARGWCRCTYTLEIK